MTKQKKVQNPPVSRTKRVYLKQADVPAVSLEEALRVPEAILDHYAGEPTAPLLVAKALNIDPQGSQLRLLSGAAIAYGLTEGGAQATSIGVTELSRSILRPKEESASSAARKTAVQRPRVFGEFLQRYDGHPLPREDIAQNVLEELGVPRDKTSEVFERIVETARAVGLLQEIRDKLHVHLSASGDSSAVSESSGASGATAIRPPDPPPLPGSATREEQPSSSRTLRRTELATAIVDDARRRRVFVTHGKNRDLVEPIKKLLEYGELEPVVSVERQSVSKPVPEKVMDEMRGCGAAIIHVDVDQTITDTSGTEGL